MTYRGRVRNGVVELPADAHLPEGTEVRVEVVDSTHPGSADDPVYSIGELAVDTGIPDLSVNLDHYLYGHRRRLQSTSGATALDL